MCFFAAKYNGQRLYEVLETITPGRYVDTQTMALFCERIASNDQRPNELHNSVFLTPTCLPRHLGVAD